MTVIVRAIRDTIRSGTGTQDFTHIDLPDAADIAGIVIYWSYHQTTDGVFSSHAQLGMGATDGVNQWCCVYSSEDGQSSTDTYRGTQTDESILILNNANGNMESEADGIVSGGAIDQGWRLNWTTEASGSINILVIVFAGTDVSVDVGTMVGPSTGSTNITGVGFEADLVLTASGDAFPNNPPSNISHLALAFCHNDGDATITTRSISTAENDSRTSGEPLTGVRNDSLGRNINVGGAGSWLSGHDLDTFDGDGWDINLENGSATRDYGYFAVNFNGAANVWVGDFTTATSAGTQANTSPGFNPQIVMFLGSRLESFNESTPNGSFRAGPVMVGVGHENNAAAIEDFVVAATVEDAAGTTNTGSVGDSKAFHCPRDDQGGSGDEQAGLQSLDALGWTLDWTEVDGTARIAIALAIEVGPAPGGFVPYPNPRYAMAGGMQSAQGGV